MLRSNDIYNYFVVLFEVTDILFFLIFSLVSFLLKPIAHNCTMKIGTTPVQNRSNFVYYARYIMLMKLNSGSNESLGTTLQFAT